MANHGIATSFGFCIAKDTFEQIPGSSPCIATDASMFVAGTEHSLGTIAIGLDIYEFKSTKEYGDNVIVVYKNSSRYGAPRATIGIFGFYCVYAQNRSIRVGYVSKNTDTDSWETFYESQSNIETGHPPGIDYYAYDLYDGSDEILVYEEEWDETPTEDPTDPDNLLPQGGEFADLGDFDETTLMLLSGLPDPESDMNMNYGGFLRTYVLDQSTLTAVGSALFAPNFWTGLKQKFEGLSDPLQMIVNCIQLPIWNIGGSAGTLRIGGIEVEDEDGHTIPVQFTSSRYIRSGMGSVTLKEIWGSEKDYNASSISIFLPYVGVKELDPDLVIGNTMTLYAYIDIWTGDITYLMHISNATATKKYFTQQSVPYRWTGNCAKTVPIGRVDNTNKLITMAGTIAGLGAGAMLAGIGGAAVAGGILSGGAGAIGASNAALGAGLGTMKAGGAIAAVTAAKALHSGFNPTVHSSSGVSGASGQMDYQYAYIMVKRGVPKYPNNWRAQIGAPNYQTFQGVSMSGYTLFSEIHLTGMSDASEAERAELERILTEEGVIL